MTTKPGNEKRTVKRLRSFTVGLLLLQLATASADSLVPGAWVQRAAGQHPADADKHAVDQFSSLEVIGLEELGGMRGGLRVAGLNIDVGAVVRTIVDGKLALESHISLATANEIAAAIGADTGSTANAALPASTAAAGGVTDSVATGTAANAAADNVTIQSSNGVANPMSNTSNFVINDAKGLTQVIHDVTRNRVVSAIFNQADRRAIRQEIDIDITVSNFREIQRAAALQRVSRALGSAGR